MATLLGPNQPQTLTGIETVHGDLAALSPAGPINLKPLQGLKHGSQAQDNVDNSGPINLKPLQGLKRKVCLTYHHRQVRPNQPQTLTGIETP